MTEGVLGPVRSVAGRLAQRQPGPGVSRGRNGAGRRKRREGLGGERGRAGRIGCGLGRRSSEGAIQAGAGVPTQDRDPDTGCTAGVRRAVTSDFR